MSKYSLTPHIDTCKLWKISQDGVVVFAHILGWPEGGLVQLGSVKPNPAIKVILTVKVDDDSCNETVIQRLPQKVPRH